jgi:hypothetical protein
MISSIETSENPFFVEQTPRAFEDFIAGVALVLRRIGHGFLLAKVTIVPPKDDLEHLLSSSGGGRVALDRATNPSGRPLLGRSSSRGGTRGR